MNVQTLPPGYKVAPWAPPEKIDGKMLAERLFLEDLNVKVDRPPWRSRAARSASWPDRQAHRNGPAPRAKSGRMYATTNPG